MRKIKKVAVISPSVMLGKRNFNESLWLEYLQGCGLEVVVMPTAFSGDKFETFVAKEKARDIMTAYKDESIDALMAIHGGAAALRVLEYLDFAEIKKHNKPIIGFSDTTSLQMAVFGMTQNPYISGFLPEYEVRDGVVNKFIDEQFKNILQNKKFEATSGETVNCGECEGVLIGGNMSTISDLSGAKYYPDLSDKILLLEDECEVSYKLSLMLTQLKYNPTFGKLRGIVFGRFSECSDHVIFGSVDEIINDFAKQVNIPIIKNFNYGHFKERYILTCGVKYRLDAKNCVLEQIAE